MLAKKHTLLLLFFSILILILFGCGSELQEGSNLIIASWNVENLFDAVDDGTETGYSQFTSKGLWTQELYNQRLSRTIKVLGTGKLKEANLFVLNEIENENVASDIISSRELSNRGFKYYVFAKDSGGPIGTAVLSKFPIKQATIHGTSYRPILEVEIEYNFLPVHILALHAKSRLDGKEGTDPIRKTTGEILSSISDSIINENPDAMIIIAGDLNDTYLDSVMMGLEDSDAPLKVSSDLNTSDWFCFWMNDEKNIWPTGSYFWSETQTWEPFDNILVKDYSDNFTISDYGVVFEGILQNAEGKPNSFVRKLMTGVSDHLPIWISVF